MEAILASGMHVGGPQIEALEREIADYVGTRHPVALNSGTDALIFGMIAGPDAVAAAVTPRTAAVMPVHLWGGICDMEALWAIAERHGLAIVEDEAQAMGTRYRNRRAGSLGTLGCFLLTHSRFSTRSATPVLSPPIP